MHRLLATLRSPHIPERPFSLIEKLLVPFLFEPDCAHCFNQGEQGDVSASDGSQDDLTNVAEPIGVLSMVRLKKVASFSMTEPRSAISTTFRRSLKVMEGKTF
jgi:hypothetical protein